MPDSRYPITVKLDRTSGQEEIDVSVYDPPLQGILWNPTNLHGLTGLYLLVEGGVTAATLEYEAGDAKKFYAEPSENGVLWTSEGLGNNTVVIPVTQHQGPFEYMPVTGAVASLAQGCKIIDGQVWCPP